MKTRFSSLDIMALLPELEAKLKGSRVNQVYDIDNKTYLLRFAKSHPNEEGNQQVEEENKLVLLLESGVRFHTTDFCWPKNNAPSGFTMKLRKHLKNKRLEAITQLGVDRIVDLQFGSKEAAYHLILELYDRGNLVITDFEYQILNILRPRKAGEDEDVKFIVREKYPVDMAKTQKDYEIPSEDSVKELLEKAKPGDTLRKVFNPKVLFGAALLEHAFITVGFEENMKLKADMAVDPVQVRLGLLEADKVLKMLPPVSKGFIIQKEEKRISKEGNDEEVVAVVSYQEFHPFLFKQHLKSTKSTFSEVETFDKAVDLFFSSIEGQKIDQKALQQEKDALKKLENIKKDHQRRLEELGKAIEADERKASLIELNNELVEKALLVMRSAVANQVAWPEIEVLLKEAQAQGDPVATIIKGLSLEKNQFTMELRDPYETEELPQIVEIDLDLTAYSNARKYYDMRRHAAKKEQKTVESSGKALKNAEHKTHQTLKEVALKTSLSKARKSYWFEKFFWAISTENYLMIAGRDAQQNEVVVKRYLRAGDLYVHADLHGAASIIIKNNEPSNPIPPRTLEEAGTLAVCYSSAWDAKIVTRSWWVYPHQVSKTAPTGEYLSVGAFMVRGKKNYLPLTQLIMGFGFLFKLDEESVEKHRNERGIKSEGELIGERLEDEEEEINLERGEESEPEEDSLFPDTKVRAISTGSDKNNVSNRANEREGASAAFAAEIIKPQEPKVKQQKILREKGKHKQEGGEQKIQKPGGEAQAEKAKQETGSLKQQSQQPAPMKRGQKSKLKKMKDKYKDQDEEEREMRLAILGSAGTKTENVGGKGTKGKKGKKKDKPLTIDLSERIKAIGLSEKVKLQMSRKIKETLEQQLEENQMPENVIEEKNEKRKSESADVDQKLEEKAEEGEDQNEGQPEQSINAEQAEDEEEEEEEEDEESKIASHVKVLDSLTGQPHAEDNLLFAIPMVGPYTALQNYKFKVKVLPGGGRRGKAAKTALHLFSTDKTATQREKDLLKSCKDLDISRNLMSKLKISAAASALSAAYKKNKKK